MAEKENEKPFEYRSIDEIISLLLEVRTDLYLIRKTVPSIEIKKDLKHVLQTVDIIGCELTQNITVKLGQIEKKNKK